MKKYFLFILFAAGFSSCSKVLNTSPLNSISSDQVWSSTVTAQDFVYNTYVNIMNNGYVQAYYPWQDQVQVVEAFTNNDLSFDGIYGYDDVQPIFSGTLTNNDDPDVGYNDFAQIRQCNLIIHNVAASKGISDADKAGLIAQGKFLRAIQNFYIAREFGKIIWIDTVLDQNTPLRLPTVASPAESYKYIIQDLQSAIAGLPATSPVGMANQMTAQAFLSEVCLEALAYSNYPSAPAVNPADPLLQLAISSAKAVISEGGYSLDPNYGGMFNGGNPNSPEVILSDQISSLNSTINSTPMQSEMLNVSSGSVTTYGGSPQMVVPGQFEGWCQGGPTEDLSDDYLVIDQNNPALALPWNSTSQFQAAVSQSTRPSLTEIPHNAGETDVQFGIVNPGSAQTIWSLTNVGRDARWGASIVSDSSVFQGQMITTCVQGNATRWMKITGSAYYVSLSNQFWGKNVWSVPAGYFWTNPTNYAWVVTRLGRVYLNLAEAYLLAGDVPDAVNAFNQTRTIHGKLPPSLASDLATAWTDYKRERRVELTLENDYYWSLLRWGMYGGNANHGNASVGDIPELDKVPTVMDISKDRKKYVITQGPYYGLNNVRHFDYPRRYLFPISVSSYIVPNGNIVQNPGW